MEKPLSMFIILIIRRKFLKNALKKLCIIAKITDLYIIESTRSVFDYSSYSFEQTSHKNDVYVRIHALVLSRPDFPLQI